MSNLTGRNYLFSSFAHFWLPTVQDVLHADWHDAWHFPQPPFFAVALKFALLIVLICFILVSSIRFMYLRISNNAVIIFNNNHTRILYHIIIFFSTFSPKTTNIFFLFYHILVSDKKFLIPSINAISIFSWFVEKNQIAKKGGKNYDK